MSEGGSDHPDMLSDFSDLDVVQHLLAELHDGLPGKVSRARMVADFGRELGPGGTMLFGGQAAYFAWAEARSSFLHGNFAATVLLCQGLVEHLLAAYLHAALMMDDIPERIPFRDTLRRCKERDVISDQDVTDLQKLMDLRNPLSHFRHLHDATSLSRRSMDTDQDTMDLLCHDAVFAIGLATRILAKQAFRVGR